MQRIKGALLAGQVAAVCELKTGQEGSLPAQEVVLQNVSSLRNEQGARRMGSIHHEIVTDAARSYMDGIKIEPNNNEFSAYFLELKV